MAVAQAEPKLMTGEELLEMGDIGPAELVEGVLVPMSPTQSLHGWIVMELARRLGNFNAERRVGWILGAESGFVTRRDPDTIRGMDVAFISRRRMPALATGFLEVAPELVVKVVSPSDRWADIRGKIAEYFHAGVEQVWIIEPFAQKLLIYNTPTDFVELLGADTLQGEGILEGFQLSLSELFEQ